MEVPVPTAYEMPPHTCSQQGRTGRFAVYRGMSQSFWPAEIHTRESGLKKALFIKRAF